MLSFWELQSFLNYDAIIVGSGIVGLSAAISIKEKDSTQKILVIERGTFPTGASTKNAGFACFGSVSELIADLEIMSDEEVVALVEERVNGLQLLRLRLGDDEIDYKQYGGYELIFEGQEHHIENIGRINALLKPIFGEDVFVQKDEMIEEFGFNPEKVKHLIFNGFEGQIDTGKMMKELLEEAQKLGIKIITGSKVVTYEEKEEEVKVVVNNLDLGESFALKCERLFICTNAFTKELVRDIDLEPGRGQVLVTKPIEDLSFKGVFHYDEGYYYFRNFEDRIIFGGGRNLDFEAEKTTEIKTSEKVMNGLVEHLKEIIIPETEFEIDHQWSGIMAFGANKEPIIKQVSDRIFLGVRLGGMGVAIGSRMGERLADLIFQEA